MAYCESFNQIEWLRPELERLTGYAAASVTGSVVGAYREKIEEKNRDQLALDLENHWTPYFVLLEILNVSSCCFREVCCVSESFYWRVLCCWREFCCWSLTVKGIQYRAVLVWSPKPPIAKWFSLVQNPSPLAYVLIFNQLFTFRIWIEPMRGTTKSLDLSHVFGS